MRSLFVFQIDLTIFAVRKRMKLYATQEDEKTLIALMECPVCAAFRLCVDLF